MRTLALAVLCFAVDTDVASPQTAFGNFAVWRIIDGAGSDMASAAAVDSQNNLYVAGITESGDLPTTPEALQANFGGGSCFAGSLLEVALAADRIYMLDDARTSIALSEMNFGGLEGAGGLCRLQARFYSDRAHVAELQQHVSQKIGAARAAELGLVTFTPDELDWDDEVRLAIETRLALSPDAITGLEANLRFGQPESMNSRIFGRLSAWQNWIFVRPNAVGPTGALKAYGTGNRAKFDWERV